MINETNSRQRALVLGLGREGASLARFLAANDFGVVVTDSAQPDRLEAAVNSLSNLPIEFHLGGEHPEAVVNVGRFFVSPGIAESNAVYRAAVRAGLKVESMTTLFFDLCPAPILGVTGSSGKTTTTGLIGHILRHAGRDVVVGGNIGDPMIDLLSNIGPDTIVVLELSSFQLDLMRVSPHIAVVTNISPNHLDRHGSMEAYVRAKRQIVEHQFENDFVVLNGRDRELAGWAQGPASTIRWFLADRHQDGSYLDDDAIWLRRGEMLRRVMPISDIPLLGRHNVENVLAAVAAADLLDVPTDMIASSIPSFTPAAHRLQWIAEKCGVEYIDDSIATTPSRAVVAMDALSSPLILIAGGRDKRLPWEDFASAAAYRARAVLLVGEATPIVEEAVLARITIDTMLKHCMVRRCDSIETAVWEAHRLAHRGDAVLLSPGCTSYDMFADFHERGLAFARAVEALDAA